MTDYRAYLHGSLDKDAYEAHRMLDELCAAAEPMADLLDELEEYLEQRADADGVPSGGGYRPNRAMTLLVELREARKRCSATHGESHREKA